jgi:putative addiction module component (TIGR02574 family)
VVEQLLKLPRQKRAELALPLWDRLDDASREAELELSPEQADELDRRLAEHLANPESALPWDEVRRKLQGGA